MALMLTKLSETATRITLGWTPVPGAIGYRFQSKTTAPKWSHTFDASRSQVTFAKDEWYKVEALGVEEAGQYPAVIPVGSPVPTYEIKQGAGAGIHAIWLLHKSSTTPNQPYYPGGPLIRNLIWATSYEWWCLYQLYIPSSWNVGADAAQYALPLDLHAVGGEPGWEDVSCTHHKFENGNLMLQHRPNATFEGGPGPELWTIAANPARDVWHSVASHFIFGRLDGTVPAAGHPNGGKGRTRIAYDGAWVVDTGNINNITRRNNVNATRVAILEGHYSENNTVPLVSRLTAPRWGSTLPAAVSDDDIVKTGDNPFGGTTYSTLSSRSTADFVLPN